MVSIPISWTKLNPVGQAAKKAADLSERHYKSLELSAIKTAEEEGYFSTITNEYLVENFCEEKHRDFRTVHYIHYAYLNNMRIRVVHCLNFGMRLRICNLSGNYITKLDPLGTCRQLIKLDVHSNQIAVIPNHHFWSGMKQLRILHLHDNPLSKLDTLQFLANCRKLQILTLHDTPLYLRKNYRHHAVNTIWSLLVLDRHLVADEEIIEDANFGGKFKTLSPSLEIDTVTLPVKDGGFQRELREFHSVLARVNRLMSRVSPVLIIQRYYRGYQTRKHYNFVLETKVWASTSIQRWWRKCKGMESAAPPPSRSKARSPKPTSKPPSATRKSTPKPTITIDLQKLNTSAIEPLDHQHSMLESELVTYRTLEAPSFIQKPPLPAPLLTPRRLHSELSISDAPRRPGINFPYMNPYGSLEIAEELSELPRVHFRLSGIKSLILQGDAVNQMIVQNLISGQQVRDADTHYHRSELYSQKPKVTKHQFVNTDQRYFSRVQGTMNLSVLTAVNKAYKERDKAEMNLANMEKIMQQREERILSKQRIEAEKDEKRRRVILERQRDKLRALETLEQQQLHSLHYLYKSQELRQRAQYFKQTVMKEQSFATDFQNQQTSISNALLRHDRQSSMETRQKSLVDFVAKHRDDEMEQQQLIRKYLDHRKTMRQTEATLANASLDTKILKESSDRIQQAHARVDQLRALKKKAKDLCTLPEERVKSIPHDDRSHRILRGLDKWNTMIYVSSGRVGKHHISLQSA